MILEQQLQHQGILILLPEGQLQTCKRNMFTHNVYCRQHISCVWMNYYIYKLLCQNRLPIKISRHSLLPSDTLNQISTCNNSPTLSQNNLYESHESITDIIIYLQL